MDKELFALFGFLGRFSTEVGGREITPPDDQVAAHLIRFVQGDCTPEERIQACEILKQNPSWIRWLANHVKLGRTAGIDSDQNTP